MNKLIEAIHDADKQTFTQQIYHWQILPIIFEFSLRSHVPNEFPPNLFNGFC